MVGREGHKSIQDEAKRRSGGVRSADLLCLPVVTHVSSRLKNIYKMYIYIYIGIYIII